MTELVANDPSLLFAVVAAIALAVVLRRLSPREREARFLRARRRASTDFAEAAWHALGEVETETIDLAPSGPIDLTQPVDLTEDRDLEGEVPRSTPGSSSRDT